MNNEGADKTQRLGAVIYRRRHRRRPDKKAWRPMPVRNVLVVKGPEEELRKLIDFIGMRLNFAKIAPMPKQIRGTFNRGSLNEESKTPDDPEHRKLVRWVYRHWGTRNPTRITRKIVSTVSDHNYFIVGAQGADQDSHDESVEVTYTFNTEPTGGGGARPAIKTLSARFPTLTFSYSWDGDFDDLGGNMLSGYGHRFIAGEYRSRCHKCQHKVIADRRARLDADDLPLITFATRGDSFVWQFCEEHKVAWFVGIYAEFLNQPPAGRAKLAEFYQRFGDDVTIRKLTFHRQSSSGVLSVSDPWRSEKKGCYETLDYDYLCKTLVSLLDDRDELQKIGSMLNVFTRVNGREPKILVEFSGWLQNAMHLFKRHHRGREPGTEQELAIWLRRMVDHFSLRNDRDVKSTEELSNWVATGDSRRLGRRSLPTATSGVQ